MAPPGSYSALNASSSARLPLSNPTDDSEDLSEVEAARAHVRGTDDEDTGLLTGEKKDEDDTEGTVPLEGKNKRWLGAVTVSLEGIDRGDHPKLRYRERGEMQN